jgi:hypothetical protein
MLPIFFGTPRVQPHAKRGVIIDITVWTPHDRQVAIHRVDQNKTRHGINNERDQDIRRPGP